MPRCDRCGADSPEGAKYCMACGHSIKPTAAAPGTSPSTPESLSQADRFLTDAFAFSDEGRLTEAVRLAQQALRLNPNSTTAHSLLGTLYERLGDRDAAIREYQSVLSLSPGSTADRKRLSELLGLPAAPQASKPSFPKLTRRSEAPQVAIFAIIALLLVAGIVLIWQVTSYSSAKRAAPALSSNPTVAAGINSAPTSAVTLSNNNNFTATALPTPGLPRDPGFVEVARPESSIPNNIAATPAANNQASLVEEVPSLPESEMPPVMELPASVLQASAANALPNSAGRILSGPLTVATPSTTLPSAGARVTARRNLVEARQLAEKGNLQEASWAYEAALAAQPNTPKPREELATVYFRLQEPKKAADNFITAYNLYSQQLQSGASDDEAEAAQHGLATCRAALRALGFQIP